MSSSQYCPCAGTGLFRAIRCQPLGWEVSKPWFHLFSDLASADTCPPQQFHFCFVRELTQKAFFLFSFFLNSKFCFQAHGRTLKACLFQPRTSLSSLLFDLTGCVQPVIAAVEGNSSTKQPPECPLCIKVLSNAGVCTKPSPVSATREGGNRITSNSASLWLSASPGIASPRHGIVFTYPAHSKATSVITLALI